MLNANAIDNRTISAFLIAEIISFKFTEFIK